MGKKRVYFSINEKIILQQEIIVKYLKGREKRWIVLHITVDLLLIFLLLLKKLMQLIDQNLQFQLLKKMQS